MDGVFIGVLTGIVIAFIIYKLVSNRSEDAPSAGGGGGGSNLPSKPDDKPKQ